MYNVNSDLRFKTPSLKSCLCNYNDACILVKVITTIAGAGADAAAVKEADERDKEVIFKNCASFINGKSEISNTEIDYVRNIDIVIPLYNLIEYNDNCSKTSGNLWKYYRNESNNTLTNFESFKSKIKITGKTPDDDNTKDVEIISSLKYSSHL